MQVLSLQQYTLEELKEMSLIEIAHAILTEKKQAVNFHELVQEIATLQQVTVEEIQYKLPQFYTDLNVDGRFSTQGENRWGLKVWYPIDQIEDEMTNPVKPKKKKAKKVVDDVLEDDFDDIEDEDLDDFDDELTVVDEDDLDDDLLADDDDLDEDLVEDDFDLVEDEDEDFEDEDDDKL